MEQTSNKKWIKIVCIVLACLLVVGLAIGAFVFFNSNYYRFRMSAFEGMYINYAEIRPHTVMNFSLTKIGEKETKYKAIFDSEHINTIYVDTSLDEPSNIVTVADFDANVFSKIEKFTKLFSNKIYIEKEGFTAVGWERSISIVENSYISYGEEESDKQPKRRVVIYDKENAIRLNCILTQCYRSPEDSSIVYGRDKSIRFYTDDIDIVGTDGEHYVLNVSALFADPIYHYQVFY